MLYTLEYQEISKLPAIGKNSLICLPPKKKTTSKIMIGDTTGIISALIIKNGTITIKYKTMPETHEISAIIYDQANDKLYYSFGHEIKAINRKGKQLFSSDTFTTETINFLGIRSRINLLYAGGSFVLNLLEIKDKGFVDKGCYIFQDKITDICLLDFDENLCLVSLHGKECILLHGTNKITSHILKSGITKMIKQYNSDKQIVYGTDNGTLGVFAISVKSITPLWEVPTGEQSSICSLEYGQILRRGTSKDPLMELCYCFESGVVQVADVQEKGCTIICSVNLGTSLTGISVGKMFSSYNEIVATTYTGNVIRVFNSQNEDKEIKQLKIQEMEKEIIALRKKLTSLKSKHKEPIVEKVLEVSKINGTLKPVPERNLHTLLIESQDTIDIVALYTECSITIIDAESGIINQPNKMEKGMLITIKYQAQPNKVDIDMQIEEGKGGVLLAYIFNSKSSLCNAISIPIKLLCNYTKVPLSGELPLMSEMQVKGVFNKSDMHMWIFNAIPDTCERSNDETEQETYTYFSNFTNSYMQCMISKNNAVFYSDSLSTIVYLQKYLIATAYETKKVHLSVQVITQECTFKTVVGYIVPKLKNLTDLLSNNALISSLKEMKTVDGCILSEKYENILKNEEQIKKEILLVQPYISYYTRILISLYEAKGFICGKLINNSIEELKRSIKECDQNGILSLIAKLSD